MRNRITKPKTKKQNRTNTNNGELQSVSLKDLNDTSGGACSHAGACCHAANQQQQPQQPQGWLARVRPGLS